MRYLDNLKETKDEKRKEFFYVVAMNPINCEMKHHICIFEKSTYELNKFSMFLRDRVGNFTLRNKSLNTIKNFHLTFIIRFLNFIFNDSKTNINTIEELTLEMVQEFLDNFSQGTLPFEKEKDWKSKNTVKRATYTISHFVYWLWWKKERNSNKKMFKMKYIRESDFQFDIVKKHSKNGYSSREVKRLVEIVTPVMSSSKKERLKVVNSSSYGIKKLFELAQENDPMLLFGIVLGAYAGLRVGDITQMFEGRIKGLYKDREIGAYLDLTYDAILRSDNTITGNIKTKRNVPIYGGCTKVIYLYYEMHISYLKTKGYYPNKFGAIFIDSYGRAMTTKTYLKRFDNLNKLFDKVIKEETMLGCVEAMKEEQIISNNKITPHSLRNYYKQLIETSEQNPRIIQYYMAHKSLDSQNSYAFANPTKEGLRKCQNELYYPIKGDIF